MYGIGLLLVCSCGDFEELEDIFTGIPAAGPLHGDFVGSYEDCDEFAGVGIVPIENVRDLVPDDYVIAEAAPGMAVVVAQAGSCAWIQVEDGAAQPGIFAQFGVSIVPPDGADAGSFYQLMFTSNHQKLAQRMKLLGANAQYSPNLQFTIAGEPTELHVRVSKPQAWGWRLDGAITRPDPNLPANPTTTFNYWHHSDRFGHVRQSNVVEGIRFGTGTAVVLTALGDELEAIVGSGPFSFPFFSNPETFDIADLTVTTDVF